MMSNPYHFRILIVDDNPENIQVAANILRSEERQLWYAKSGNEALERLKEQAYDLILMDVMMPEMDGFETVRHIKAIPEYKHVPIIFVTAKTADEDILEGFYSGGVDYVTKPYKEVELLARVNTHLMLKSYQDRLEERVAEETQKRMEQQEVLVRQSRLAAMGEMMGAITHQWNQPLTVTTMYLDYAKSLLTEQESAPQEVLDQLDQAAGSLGFMSQTIRDFKNFFNPSKLKENFLVHQEVAAILGMLAPQMKLHTIQTGIEIDSKLTLYGVASEFKQVILNLLSNAKDAIISKTNGKNNGIITITACAADHLLKIEVQDSGGGIPKEVLPKIFDEHFTTKEAKGTGIGLSMTKMIVEESFQGIIKAENRNEGACFILELPIDSSKL